MGLFSWLRSRTPDTGDQRDHSLDARLGTGLWRQHRDRFGRAVDRLYTTAVQAQKEAPNTPSVLAVVELTHRLSELDQRAAGIAEYAHSRWPVEGLVLPADVRLQAGDLPELLSHAAGKVSEAVQAAAHVRVSARQVKSTAHNEAGQPTDTEGTLADDFPAAEAPAADASAAAAARFVDDAEHLIAQAHARTLGKESP